MLYVCLHEGEQISDFNCEEREQTGFILVRRGCINLSLTGLNWSFGRWWRWRGRWWRQNFLSVSLHLRESHAFIQRPWLALLKPGVWFSSITEHRTGSREERTEGGDGFPLQQQNQAMRARTPPPKKNREEFVFCWNFLNLVLSFKLVQTSRVFVDFVDASSAQEPSRGVAAVRLYAAWCALDDRVIVWARESVCV